MRKLLLALCFVGLAGTAQAQTLARAKVTATVRVPDFLSMRVAESTAISGNARRMTVYVTANRMWQLSLSSECTDCTVRMESAGHAASRQLEGSNGNDIPVIVEYTWRAGDREPDPAHLHYLLTPA